MSLDELIRRIPKAELYPGTGGLSALYPGGVAAGGVAARIQARSGRGGGSENGRSVNWAFVAPMLSAQRRLQCAGTMDLAGWKSEKTMRRYAAVTDQTLRRLRKR